MAGEPVQASDVLQAAAAAHTVADIAGLLRDLRRRHARWRRDSPLTYRELAARTGWSQAAIGEYFTGRTLPPTDRFDALVVLLGATAAEQGVLGTARDRAEEARRAAAPAGDRTPRAGGGVVPVARQLPRDVAGFAGRAGELARLDALLDEGSRVPAVVISAISGTAGIGKTALALHWAHRIADRFPDGQLYANLRGFDPGGTPMPPAEAVRRFLDALDVPPQRIPADPDAQAALYRSLLADKRVLLVLDNARDPTQIRPLLPGAPGCLVLVTSRNQLSGLVAADGAHPLPLGPLTPTEADDLLIGRLGPGRVAAEPDAVAQIITACARLPLALAIVAAHAATQPQRSLAALANELHDRHNRLDALSTGDPATDVRAVFSWSYRTLTDSAARLFRQLGLHPGPDISAPAAASLTGLPLSQTRPLLAELSRANLLSEQTFGRYAFHDLLRAYAVERAHAEESETGRAAALLRTADHYLHTAHGATVVLNPQRDPIALPERNPEVTPEAIGHLQALAWFTAERAVLLAVLAQAASAGFDGHTWRLSWTLLEFFDRRGHWPDWITAGHAALAAARQAGDQTGQAHTHHGLGRAYARLNHADRAHQHLTQALDLFTALGDLASQANVQHAIALVHELQGCHVEAFRHAERALDLYAAAGHQAGQARVLNGIGWHYAMVGDHRTALDYCRRALVLLKTLGDRRIEAATWDSLGFAHHHLDEYEPAAACYRHALALTRELGDRPLEAEALTHLGDSHAAAGNPHAARDAWQHALTILTDLGHPDTEHVRTKLARLD